MNDRLEQIEESIVVLMSFGLEADESFLSRNDEMFNKGEEVVLLRTGGIKGSEECTDRFVGKRFFVKSVTEHLAVGDTIQDLLLTDGVDSFYTTTYSDVYYIKNVTHSYNLLVDEELERADDMADLLYMEV